MFIKPQLATLYDGFPPGKWIYEVKFDGYRMQANRKGGKSRFYTRSGLDWLSKFSFINEGLNKLVILLAANSLMPPAQVQGICKEFLVVSANIQKNRQG